MKRGRGMAAVKHDPKLVRKAARYFEGGGRHTLRIEVRVRRSGPTAGTFTAQACVWRGGLRETRRGRVYFVPTRCARGARGRTPTAAVRTALTKLARKLK